jgi:hypothetical protein
LENIRGPALDYILSDQLEVEGPRHFLDDGRVFLGLFAYSLDALLGCFALQLLELFLLFAFLRWRGRLPIAFQELLERNAVDQNHSQDIDFLGLQAPFRVKAPIDFGILIWPSSDFCFGPPL